LESPYQKGGLNVPSPIAGICAREERGRWGVVLPTLLDEVLEFDVTDTTLLPFQLSIPVSASISLIDGICQPNKIP
jgi:hypothetical protein